MSQAIEGLKPELFWHYFAELSRVPRPSRHEERAARYVLDQAQRLGLSARQDAFGNVVVRKPATPGRERVRPLCLQSHLDMVCEKNADKVHDFMTDPIELVREGDVIKANGTTLGGDNGVGVAASLAVMADRNLVHGPLEFLFTVEEEIGLTGALNLSPDLLESRTMLNLDSEEEGAFYVGCAGGRDSLGTWRPVWEAAPEGSLAFSLSVKGLKGGHSGIDIGKGLGNAIKLLNRAVLALAGIGARLASLEGGKMRNAIPRECRALLLIPSEGVERARELVGRLDATLKAELAAVDPGVALELTPGDEAASSPVLAPELQRRLCLTIAGLPTGVQHMSAEIPGLVETSTNVSVVTTSRDEIVVTTSQRSSRASRLDDTVATVGAIFALGGATVATSDGYPGWQPDLKSPILQAALASYRSLYGRDAEVKAIHAGLECGIIGERVPGMDMVSLGPTLEAVHSPDEKIYIESVGKFWELLVKILASLDQDV